MSLLDNISNKVKASFENETLKAPSSVWDKVNTSLDDKLIDNKIKSSFEKSSLKAPVFNFPDSFENKFNIDKKVSESFEKERNVLPDSIWKNIENNLDINRVWNTISNQIKINNFSWSKFAVAGLLIGFISLLPPTQIKNPEVINNSFIFGESNLSLNNTVDNTILPSIKNGQLAIIKKTIVKDLSIKSNPKVLLANNFHKPNDFVVNNTPELVEEIINIDKINIPISFINQDLVNNMTAPSEITAVINSEKQSHFRIGLLASINNTLINNDDTRSSFNKNSLLSSKMAFGESRGITADYYFNNSFGISATYLLQSRIRNKIGYYENGFYQERITEINYTKGAILFNYSKPILSKKSNQKYIFSAGPYLAYNKGSMTVSGETITSFNSTYKKFDYGLKLQIGKEHQWSNLVLGYGLNTDVGVRNVLLSNNLNPSNSYSSNFNIGLYTALKYQF